MFPGVAHVPRRSFHRSATNGAQNDYPRCEHGLENFGKDSRVQRSSVCCLRILDCDQQADLGYSEALSKNVTIWVWMTRIFAAAIPNLTTRSVGPLASLNDPDKGVTPQESTALIIKNYQGLKDDLQMLNKLMHIARNLLVTSEPEVPQDICAAVHFDQMVYQTIILCVNVTSKGYDGEVLDDVSRARLNEITDLCESA